MILVRRFRIRSRPGRSSRLRSTGIGHDLVGMNLIDAGLIGLLERNVKGLAFPDRFSRDQVVQVLMISFQGHSEHRLECGEPLRRIGSERGGKSFRQFGLSELFGRSWSVGWTELRSGHGIDLFRNQPVSEIVRPFGIVQVLLLAFSNQFGYRRRDRPEIGVGSVLLFRNGVVVNTRSGIVRAVSHVAGRCFVDLRVVPPLEAIFFGRHSRAESWRGERARSLDPGETGRFPTKRYCGGLTRDELHSNRRIFFEWRSRKCEPNSGLGPHAPGALCDLGRRGSDRFPTDRR